MKTNQQLYVHVGAPRTGTSFMRKHVFPKIKNVLFLDKESCETELTKYFSSISHWGDGDELSSSIQMEIPKMGASKILVSEEHMIWSVYHMMGNIGSRALLLKQVAPDAKIILTIRRQPEYFISIYQYYQQLERRHLARQMRSINNMLNMADSIKSFRIHWLWFIPCGVEVERDLATFSVDEAYFQRQLRQFIVADFSWNQLYNIYSDLFGEENVLVLPQEVWQKDPNSAMYAIENFIGESIDNNIPFTTKVNSSSNTGKTFSSTFERERFTNFIMSLVSKSNLELAKKLKYFDLESLGYCMLPEQAKKITLYGIRRKHVTILSKKFLLPLNKLKTYHDRAGSLNTLVIVMKKLLSRFKDKKQWKKIFYKIYMRLTEQFKGIDFEQIESTERLGLDKSISEQYEATKLVELKKIIQETSLPKGCQALDFGAGKGLVVWYLSTLPEILKVTGIEISPALVTIAKYNLKKLRVQNTEMLCLDARETPLSIINDAQLFYFYNPFPRSVFEDVLHLIEMSITSHRPRKAVLIYFNPVYDDCLQNSSVFLVRREFCNEISKANTLVYSTC